MSSHVPSTMSHSARRGLHTLRGFARVRIATQLVAGRPHDRRAFAVEQARLLGSVGDDRCGHDEARLPVRDVAVQHRRARRKRPIRFGTCDQPRFSRSPARSSERHCDPRTRAAPTRAAGSCEDQRHGSLPDRSRGRTFRSRPRSNVHPINTRSDGLTGFVDLDVQAAVASIDGSPRRSAVVPGGEPAVR